MAANPLLQTLLKHGIVGVVRTPSPDTAKRAVEAVLAGGIRVVEITFTVPDATKVIASVASTLGNDVVLGAGTVTNAEKAKAAIGAGAKFIVAPNTDPSTISTSRACGVLAIPGALTPTEVVNAVNAGADAVKIFPASVFGPSYLKALRGPLPDVVLMPTGGVEPGNLYDYLAAGAKLLGAGGTLVEPRLVAAGDFAAISRKAKAFVDAFDAAVSRLAGAVT